MSPHDKCRGCGAPIIWIRTRDGKHMPCNPEVVEIDPAGAKTMCIVTNDGGVEWGSYVSTNVTKTSTIAHAASCFWNC